MKPHKGMEGDSITRTRAIGLLTGRAALEPCKEFPKEPVGSKFGPPHYSCWTMREDFRENAADYRDDAVAEILSDDYPCASCLARFFIYGPRFPREASANPRPPEER